MPLPQSPPALRAGLIAFACIASACDRDPAGVEPACDAPDIVFPSRAIGSIAITNTNVIAMSGSAEIEAGRTVIVVNGVIDRVGATGSTAVPAGATVIDGTCRYVMPGLADMHVHLNYTNEPLLYVANGVTTVREMWGSTGHIAYRARITNGELIGPSMYIGSPGMDGVVSWPRTVLITNPVKADTLIAQLVRDHFDFVKVYENLSGEVFDSIVAAAKRRGIPIAGHVGSAVGVERALAAGQRSIEHMASAYLPAVRASGNTQGWWNTAIDDGLTRQLARRIAATTTWATPTLATLEAMLSPSEEAAFFGRPESRYVSPSLLTDWVVRGPWGDPSIRDDAIDNESRAAKIFFDEGVNLLVGSDAGFTYVLPGYALHDELRMLVDAGMTPGDVLLAATNGAARFLGGTGTFGSIRAGLRADLLLLDASPITDIANAAHRAGVMTAGRWYSEVELNRLLEASVASAASRSERISAAGVQDAARH